MRLSRHKASAWCNSVYSRITLTKITTLFFVFSFLHCLFQGIIQSFLYSLDSDQRDFLSAIVSSGRIPPKNTTFLQGPAGRLHLQICDDIPYEIGQKRYPCTTIFNSTVDSFLNPQPTRAFDRGSRAVSISRAVDPPGAVILQSATTPSAILLNPRCVQNLVHPQQRLTNSRREDITFISLQFWLLGISVFAIVNDSVPHVLTVVITRILFTAWSIYAVWRTRYDDDTYKEIIVRSGTPCSLDVFSQYFKTRFAFQVTDMVMAVVALGVAVYLSYKLLKTYNSQAFKCFGAPPHVHRVNKYFMALLACLQLEVFILVAGMSMWIDVLLNTAIAKISAHTPEYIAVFIASAVLLLPWIMMGWYAIKREKRILTLAFLVIAFIIIVGWSVMFYSMVYRWTFMQWPFLGVFTVASLVLLTTSIVLGITCRLHFGKGHAEYLQAEAALASLNFTKEIFTRDEKKESFDIVEDDKIYYVTSREGGLNLDGENGEEGNIQSLPRLARPFPV